MLFYCLLEEKFNCSECEESFCLFPCDCSIIGLLLVCSGSSFCIVGD